MRAFPLKRLVFLYLLLTRALARSPIIIIPGLMGSKLDWNIHSYDGMSLLCQLTGRDKWMLVWLAPLYDIANVECLEEGLAVTCSASETDAYGLPICRNTLDVDIRPEDFGGFEGIDLIANVGFKKIPYFRDFISRLVDNGWVAGKSLFGAPYDWRLVPASFAQPSNVFDDAELNGTDFDRLRHLIEKAVALNNDQPAVLLAHSLGSVVVTAFLQHMGASWKATHVKGVLYVAPAYGGASKASAFLLTGVSMGNLPDESLLYHLGGTWTAIPALALSPEVVGDDMPLLQFRNGSVVNYGDLYEATEAMHGTDKAQTARKFGDYARTVITTPTMVPSHVVIGVGHDTAMSYVEKHNILGTEIEVLSNEDGDNTVPRRSAFGATKALIEATERVSGPVITTSECEGTHIELISNMDVANRCVFPKLLEMAE